jgi:hypothetical protein
LPHLFAEAGAVRGGTRHRLAITTMKRGYGHMAEYRPTEPEHTDEPSTHTDPVGLLYVSDVQALRGADTVSFHTVDGEAYIHACLSGAVLGQPRVYTPRQQRLFPDAQRRDRRRRIEVAADIAGFDAQRRWHEHHLPGATAFTIIDAAQLDEVWRSLAAFLRVGDVIGLHWRADNPADVLRDPALHRDELRLAVRRGARWWMFLLDVQVRRDPARMITRASG